MCVLLSVPLPGVILALASRVIAYHCFLLYVKQNNNVTVLFHILTNRKSMSVACFTSKCHSCTNKIIKHQCCLFYGQASFLSSKIIKQQCCLLYVKMVKWFSLKRSWKTSCTHYSFGNFFYEGWRELYHFLFFSWCNIIEDRLCCRVVRVRFPALPDFPRSSGSGTGSTQPREYNWRAIWKKN
jgi:hypothetical protein